MRFTQEEWAPYWKSVLRDLSQFEAAISLYLQESYLERVVDHGEHLSFEIHFPQSFEGDFQALKASSEYQNRLRNYFAIIAEKPVQIQLTISNQGDSEEIIRRAALRQFAGSDEYYWQTALLEAPGLKDLAQSLELHLLNSRKIEGDLDDKSQENPSEEAEIEAEGE